MQSPAMPSPVRHTIEESIHFRPDERTRLLTRTGWDAFIANVPLPALWVTAHVDLSPSRPSNEALEQLKMDLAGSRSKDSIADSYRSFLQKLITKLNRKILKSRVSTRTFRFLGSSERSPCGLNSKELHYHFFLWDPANLFVHDPMALDRTAKTLKSLWLEKINSKETARYKPIDIQIIRDREDAVRVAAYTNKSNPFVTSYELFDDWSTSRQWSTSIDNCH